MVEKLKKMVIKIPESRKYQAFLLLSVFSFIILLTGAGKATFLQWAGFIISLYSLYTTGNSIEHHISRKKEQDVLKEKVVTEAK